MNRKLTRKLEMATRVLEFQRAHPFSDRNQIAVATQFGKRLQEADALALAEHQEQIAARGAMRDAQEVRRRLEVHLLPSVASIGAFALRGDQQAAGRFTAPSSNKSRAAFLTQAASRVEAAREHQEALMRHGMTRAQLAELGTSLTQFKTVTAQATNAQHRHRETRSKLVRALADVSDLLRLLDAFYRVRLQNDAGLLRVWTALRTVGRAAATRSEPANTEGTGAPPATGSDNPLPDQRQDDAA